MRKYVSLFVCLCFMPVLACTESPPTDYKENWPQWRGSDANGVSLYGKPPVNWDESKNIGAFICINPSKATSLMSDNTLSNCNNLAVQWSWGGFYIVNLFAYMATDQNDMKKQKEKVGKLNDKTIKYIIKAPANIAKRYPRSCPEWGGTP